MEHLIQNKCIDELNMDALTVPTNAPQNMYVFRCPGKRNQHCNNGIILSINLNVD